MNTSTLSQKHQDLLFDYCHFLLTNLRNYTQTCFSELSLTRAARAVGQTIYQLKQSLLDDYLRQQMLNPTISINI